MGKPTLSIPGTYIEIAGPIPRRKIMDPDELLTGIAQDYLGIPTLETRNSDSLDFHPLAVWQIEAALKQAYQLGFRHGCINQSLDALKPPLSVSTNEIKSAQATKDVDGNMYIEAVAIVRSSRKASITFLQRKLRVGYNRAARLLEAMEADGIVSHIGSDGSRTVIGD